MIVGGNIDGVTRVMTTTIALETSKGDLPLALGARHHPDRDRARAQCGGADIARNGAAPLRMAERMHAPTLLPLRLRPRSASFAAGGTRDHRRHLDSTIERRAAHASSSDPTAPARACCCACCHGLLAPTAGTIAWGGATRRRPAAPGHGVPAAGDAAPLGARATCATRSKLAGVPRATRERAHRDALDAVGLAAPRRPRRARAVRRRAAAARAGARVGAAARGAVPRRADGEPRSRARRARSRRSSRAIARARHQDRDDARTTSARRGASPTRSCSCIAAGSSSARRRPLSSATRAAPKRPPSSKENCHG